MLVGDHGSFHLSLCIITFQHKIIIWQAVSICACERVFVIFSHFQSIIVIIQHVSMIKRKRMENENTIKEMSTEKEEEKKHNFL